MFGREENQKKWAWVGQDANFGNCMTIENYDNGKPEFSEHREWGRIV